MMKDVFYLLTLLAGLLLSTQALAERSVVSPAEEEQRTANTTGDVFGVPELQFDWRLTSLELETRDLFDVLGDVVSNREAVPVGRIWHTPALMTFNDPVVASEWSRPF